MRYYFRGISKLFDFEGRATRAEYWYFVLFNILIQIALIATLPFLLSWLDGGTANVEQLAVITFFGYRAFIMIPGFSLTCRRLHDTGRSGITMLIALIPLVGQFALLVFLAEKGTPGWNRYGNPVDPLPVEPTLSSTRLSYNLTSGG